MKRATRQTVRQSSVERSVVEAGRKRGKQKRKKRLLMSLATIVIFVTTYALILPALTMEAKTYCGCEEAHGKNCYGTVSVLACGQEEGKNHTHSKKCYEQVEMLICHKEQHEHTAQCFSNPDAPVMTLQEVEERAEAAGVSVGGSDSSSSDSGSSNGGSSDSAPSDSGSSNGGSSDSASSDSGSSDSSSSDSASSDSSGGGESSDSGSNMSVGENVAAFAESQKGVQESEEKYKAEPDGDRLGANPYSEAAFGDDCAEWNTSFAVVALAGGGVDQETVPVAEDCYDWIGALAADDVDLFHNANNEEDTYTPSEGDLIFHLDDEGEPAVGIVTEVGKTEKDGSQKLKVVEGDRNDRVEKFTVETDDDIILGYGEIPDETVAEAPEVDLANLPSREEAEAAAEGETPAETDPAAEGETTAETDPAAEGETPAETDPAAEGETPVEADPAAEGETPVETDPAAEGETPAEADPAAEGETPVEGELVEEPLPVLEEVVDEWLLAKTTEEFTMSAICAEGITVTVTGATDSLPYPPEEITVSAQVVTDPAILDAMYQAAAAQGIDLSGQVMLDVCLWHGEELIEPCGPVNVSFAGYEPAAASLNEESIVEETQVYHMDTEEAVLTDMSAEVEEDGTMVLETDHFSFYVLGYTLKESSTVYQYEKVTSVNTTDKYLIVSASGYALTAGTTEGTNTVTKATVTAGPDKNGFYTISVDGTNTALLWQFGGEQSGTVKNAGGNTYLTLRKASATSTTSTTINYSCTNGSWILSKNGTYYLSQSGTGAFARATATTYASMTIYRQVEVPGQEEEVQNLEEDMNFEAEVKPAALKTISPTPVLTDTVPEPGGMSDVKMDYASDAGTSDLENPANARGFKGTTKDDGKVMTDKSVAYGQNPYYSFSDYGYDEFSVTLSALAQQYIWTKSTQQGTPVDVVLVLDLSGSMVNNKANVNGADWTRAKIAVTAANTLIKNLMEYHEDNRVGVVTYNDGSQKLLDIGRYTATNGTYLDYSDSYSSSQQTTIGTVKTNSSLKVEDGSAVSEQSRTVGGGTYTQHGIARAKQLFEAIKDTTYTSNGITVPRTPIVIILSDGDPTYCTNEYNNVLGATSHYGSGVYTNNNNKGIHGFYTILSANYYKTQIGQQYNTVPKMYTIGMGIYTTGHGDASNQSYTDDQYKRTVLNPTAENVLDLENGAKNKDVTSMLLQKLLTSTYTSNTVTVGNGKTIDSKSTKTTVPVIKNPYSNYSYANGAYFRDNYDPVLLSEIFDDIIRENMGLIVYEESLTENTDLIITDTIGDGMELKGAPILRYDGKNYSYETMVEENGKTTYTYGGVGTVKASQYADPQQLSGIEVEVSQNAEGKNQIITWTIPGELVPEFTKAKTADWFYGEYPARLIYKVGLTQAEKDTIAAMSPSQLYYSHPTYYTNESAEATIYPKYNNPYYTEDRSDSTSWTKSVNASGSSDTYYEIDQDGVTKSDTSQQVTVQAVLGNNGKLTFGTTRPEEEIIAKEPDHSKWIDAFRDGVDNPDTEVDSKPSTDADDIFDRYRLYLNVGPESAYEAVDILFVMDVSSSMARDDVQGGTNSGFNGFDATDLLGNSPVWRCWALDTLLNGQSSSDAVPGGTAAYTAGNNSAQHQQKLYANGLIGKLKSFNPDNKISVVSFAESATINQTWTRVGGMTTGVKNYNNRSTNYIDALAKARALLEADAVKNDGNKKLMVFLSDGTPTVYYDNSGAAVTDATGTEPAAQTATAISQFKSDYADMLASGDLEICTIAVGNWDLKLMNSLSTSGSTYQSTNFQTLLNELEKKITNGAGTYSKMTITDTLSQNVDFYKDEGGNYDIDLVVQKIPSSCETLEEVKDDAILLYKGEIENGSFAGKYKNDGESYIKSVSLSPETKTVTVQFADDLEQLGDYRYSISFNVKTTLTAYNKFVEQGGYGHEKGDPCTDYIYNGNTTSSNQYGFFSNDTATLTYTQTLGGKTYSDKSLKFDDPVIQVRTQNLVVKKLWSNGNENHVMTEPIQVKVSRQWQETGDWEEIGTYELSAQNDWEYAIPDQQVKGYSYKLEELDPGIYKPTYSEQPSISDDGSTRTLTFTVENTPNSYLLPHTGGGGTTGLYVGGAMLLVGAMGLLYWKRREAM